jgi:hypothetical protein
MGRGGEGEGERDAIHVANLLHLGIDVIMTDTVKLYSVII